MQKMISQTGMLMKSCLQKMMDKRSQNAIECCALVYLGLVFQRSVGFTSVVPAGSGPRAHSWDFSRGAGVGLETVACNQHAGVRPEYNGYSRCTLSMKTR